jgi:hypothetical protein
MWYFQRALKKPYCLQNRPCVYWINIKIDWNMFTFTRLKNVYNTKVTYFRCFRLYMQIIIIAIISSSEWIIWFQSPLYYISISHISPFSKRFWHLNRLVIKVCISNLSITANIKAEKAEDSKFPKVIQWYLILN